MGKRKAGGRAGRKQVLIISRKGGGGAVEVFLGGRIRWKKGDQFWKGGVKVFRDSNYVFYFTTLI